MIVIDDSLADTWTHRERPIFIGQVKQSGRCAIMGRHTDVSGALYLHRTVATQRNFSASMGDVWTHQDGRIENWTLEMLSCDHATVGAIRGLTSTQRSKSDDRMMLDCEIVVHDHRAIIVHDYHDDRGQESILTGSNGPDF